MKRIFKASAGLVLLIAVASCDMNLRPYSVIDPDNALESYADAEKLANGFNNQIRSLAVGSKIYAPEIQADLFHASSSYGNRGGDVYEWTFSEGVSYAESLWSTCYTAIANANYFISKVAYVNDKVANDEEFAASWSEKELTKLSGHLSEAYFLRAYAHYLLIDRFCDAYDSSTASEENSGIPIVTEYVPTSDKSKYPGRSTLEASFEQVYKDLEEAEKNIGALRENKAGSNYITEDAVKALRARVALARKDYSQAISDATAVIDSGRYSLVDSVDGLNELFTNDNVPSEVILQSYIKISTEAPGSNDYQYIGYTYSKQQYSPDYIPEQWLVDLYDDKDYRKEVFFKSVNVTLNGVTVETPVYLFYKFPGNPALMSGASDYNYLNAPKPFRLAELYLIAAEAYANSGLSDAVSKGSDYLNAQKQANSRLYR